MRVGGRDIDLYILFSCISEISLLNAFKWHFNAYKEMAFLFSYIFKARYNFLKDWHLFLLDAPSAYIFRLLRKQMTLRNNLIFHLIYYIIPVRKFNNFQILLLFLCPLLYSVSFYSRMCKRH